MFQVSWLVPASNVMLAEPVAGDPVPTPALACAPSMETVRLVIWATAGVDSAVAMTVARADLRSVESMIVVQVEEMSRTSFQGGRRNGA